MNKWIDKVDKIDSKYGRHDYICPKCNKRATYFVGGTENWWCVDKPNFCSYCGTDMRPSKNDIEKNPTG